MKMTPQTMTTAAPPAPSPDQDAFRALIGPYRPTLLRHCYRMLGSYQDAEDVLQETLLAAWQGLDGFEARASLRTWLYRIATNRCLNALRAARRRPAKAWDIPGVVPPDPTRLNEVVWLGPFPDDADDGVAGTSPAPDVLYERSQAISLAFITALQRLPPRQLAALVLCEVVGFSAQETAGILKTTLDAVNSALKRARAALQQDQSDPGNPPPAAGTPAEAALLARFVTAWQAADVSALVSLLTDDVFMAMPPMPFEYVGLDLVSAFTANLFASGRRFDLVPTRANGQPAFGVYLRTNAGVRPGIGLYVLTLSGDRIHGMTRFESHVLPWFGLPPSLP